MTGIQEDPPCHESVVFVALAVSQRMKNIRAR